MDDLWLSSGDPLLAGRGAIVTGASRGIGRAIAKALAAEGALVVVNGRDVQVVREVVQSIEADGGSAYGVPGSVADFETTAQMVDQSEEILGGIDILVNCAGIAEPAGSSIMDLSEEAWAELIGVHLTGTFNTCRHVVPKMVERGQGVILNTSSHAYTGRYGGTGYAAGKGGVNSLTYALAAELKEHGIRVNAICPGARTRLSEGDEYEQHIDRLHARGLLNDLTRQASLDPPDPKYVGPAAVFLVSDLSKGFSGQLLTARGGYVGLHAAPQESLLAYRDEAEGPWPVAELAQRVSEGLAVPTDEPSEGP